METSRSAHKTASAGKPARPACSRVRVAASAVRPNPPQYVFSGALKNGVRFTMRPIRPADEPFMVKFHKTLSEESVYHRYFGLFKLDQRIAHQRLTRVCVNDTERDICLVAERRDAPGATLEILGVGRLCKHPGGGVAEFALLISDLWQKQGLGTEFLKRLVHIGRKEKLKRITAVILADNLAMQHVSKKAGFTVKHDDDSHDYIAEYQF